ncbi:MAG: hypothetical protein ACI8X5_000883 [Planctomycetota bacterium]|jgi:hypothetical protein
MQILSSVSIKSSLALSLLAGGLASSAQAGGDCPDDAFEPNDTCLTAITLEAGSYPDLVTTETSDDFFSSGCPTRRACEVFHCLGWEWIHHSI